MMACKAKREIASNGGRRGKGQGKNIIPHIRSYRKEQNKMSCCRFNDNKKLACDV